MEAGVSPLLSSIEDAIEAIFLTAHKEDFSMEAESKQVPPPSFPQYSGVLIIETKPLKPVLWIRNRIWIRIKSLPIRTLVHFSHL
jgi:hypothetical protein